MPRSLITGGAGFIGSHLAEELLHRGEEVYIIDNLSTGSHRQHPPPQGPPQASTTTSTRSTNEPVLAELVDTCDVVYHLAAAVGVKLIVESPVNTIETNVHGTEVVLKHANKKKKMIVIASTSEVYGKATDVPFREESDLVLGPTSKGRWSYACSKAIDEFLAIAYWREKRLPVVVVRLFNTVGPRQTGRYGMVVPTLRQAGAAGRADHRLWRRHPVALLHLRWRRGERADCADGPPEGRRRSLQYRQRPRGHDEPARANGENHDGSESEIVHIPYEEAYEQGFEDMLPARARHH